jgi:DNA-binding IclR family transcriptional regulator
MAIELAGAQRPIGTVARVSELIRYLAEQTGEVAVTTLARDLSLPPSTVHRLLHLLMDQGFVERGERFQSYRVGGELYRLGCLVSRKIGIAELADPIMRGLSAESGEFSMLTLYLPSEHKLTLVHTVAVPTPLTYRAELFSQLSIAWGASGRAILASLSENEIRAIHLKTGPSPVSGVSLPPYAEFREQLRVIAARGYARTNAQRMAGAVGMASPVRNTAGKPIGSLCLTIPEFRFDPAREQELGAMLRERAAALSHVNGGARSRAAC